MKKLTLLLTLLAVFTLGGCGYKEGVKIESQGAYFYFTGFNQENTTVLASIDKGEKFPVQAGNAHQYKIKPGKHLIEVYKDGEKVVEREVYVGDGIAKEIEVQ